MLRYLLLVNDHSNATFEVRLYQHSVGSNVHYGLVTVPTAFDRLTVRGGSRGGNVALLLGIRDPRVTVVAAASAPTDFYREAVRINYGDQYHCQFFAGKTSEQARLRMLASSPLHFTLAAGVKQVWLDHGTADEVVPLWNATEMAARLKTQPLLSDLMTYSGASHNLSQASGFGERQHMIYEMFLH